MEIAEIPKFATRRLVKVSEFALPMRRWLINHLVIVCCHAICWREIANGNGTDPAEW